MGWCACTNVRHSCTGGSLACLSILPLAPLLHSNTPSRLVSSPNCLSDDAWVPGHVQCALDVINVLRASRVPANLVHVLHSGDTRASLRAAPAPNKKLEFDAYIAP
jgi:hypothetical protein